MFRYPDDFVKPHDRLWFSSTPFPNAPLRQSMTYFISFWSNTNKRRHHLAGWARAQYFTHGHSTDPPTIHVELSKRVSAITIQTIGQVAYFLRGGSKSQWSIFELMRSTRCMTNYPLILTF